MNLITQKMGLHEWSYSNDYDAGKRTKMPHVDLRERFKSLDIEVELGFNAEAAAREVERCLNCDVQTKFTDKLCIECDACIDVCPLLCLTITENREEPDLRKLLTVPADNLKQDLYASGPLPQTKRIMVKDEDVCVHCGLCAERCPTGAWDMQKFELVISYAGQSACNQEQQK
jgi:ferredoxin